MTEQDSSFQGIEVRRLFILNRGIRIVPLNWEHPRDPRDGSGFKPLLPREHFDNESFEECRDENPGLTREEFESWHMPDFSSVPDDQMGICAYETTSEGTPISPVFHNTPEGRFQMAKYCAENRTVFAANKADIETWAAILFSGNTAVVDLHTRRVEISDDKVDNA